MRIENCPIAFLLYAYWHICTMLSIKRNLIYIHELNWNFQIFNPNTYAFRKLDF